MVDKTTADDITLIAKKQLATSALFKQPRMTEILDTENMYDYKLRPALQGRLNVPFDGVVLAGFIDTLVAQVNRPPKIQFEDPTGANLKGARKVSAAWDRDQKRMRLKLKDRTGKKLAAIAGRAIFKFYAESDPEYNPCIDNIDHLDFHCEPNGGGHLDNHYFMGQENIFRTKERLLDGVKSGWYDSAQVRAVIKGYDSPDFKRNDDTFNNKQSRYASLGLDMQANNYIGGTLYNLVEWITFYQGIKYHVIFEKYTNTWVRCVPLKEDFEDDRTPFISYASPLEDAFNFWNRGPADQIKPIAEAIRLNLNEVLNNNRKRNWDMKVVDGAAFTDIKKLDWKQDGIVAGKVGLTGRIQDAIYRFETPEIKGALDLNSYLNNMAGEKLGITAATQGDANEEKVGIYQGNQVQISKRMRLISDSYEEMYEDLGVRYDWGLWTHADEKEMVRLISADGVGWEKITREDKDPEYAVAVISSALEMAMTDDEKKIQLQALLSIENIPAQMTFVNVKAHIEEKYRLAGFTDEKIRKLMDTKADATDELLSEAKKAIELILEGKNPGINYSATTGYLKYISDWILDNAEDLTPEKKAALETYWEKHYPVAMKNAEHEQFETERLAKIEAAKNPPMPVKPGAKPAVPGISAAPVAPVAPVTPGMASLAR